MSTGSALSILVFTRLYGFPIGTACGFAILFSIKSFLDPLSPESRLSKPGLR